MSIFSLSEEVRYLRGLADSLENLGLMDSRLESLDLDLDNLALIKEELIDLNTVWTTGSNPVTELLEIKNALVSIDGTRFSALINAIEASKSKVIKQFNFTNGRLGFFPFNSGPQSMADITDGDGLKVQLSDTSGNPSTTDGGFYSWALSTVMVPGDWISFNIQRTIGGNHDYIAKIVLNDETQAVGTSQIVIPAVDTNIHTVSFVANSNIRFIQVLVHFIADLNGLDTNEWLITQADFRLSNGAS